MTEITFKVNGRELIRQLNALDLSNMTPKDLKKYIKENIQVTLLGSSNGDNRFYLYIEESEE